MRNAYISAADMLILAIMNLTGRCLAMSAHLTKYGVAVIEDMQ
jgi:hypothetical protein